MGATDIQCVSTFRGSVDGAKFVQFLRDDLVPILEPFNGINHNSVVVMGTYRRTEHLRFKIKYDYMYIVVDSSSIACKGSTVLNKLC